MGRNITWLTHWGLTEDKEFSGWKKSHTLGRVSAWRRRASKHELPVKRDLYALQFGRCQCCYPKEDRK